MEWKKKLLCGVLCAAQLACMVPAAFAQQADAAELTKTATLERTMSDLRNDPDIQKTGIALYGKFGEGTSLTRHTFDNQKFEDYIWGDSAETNAEAAKALDLAVQNAEDGVQVTWQVYSPEEIEANSSLGCVQLYYFPGENPGGKYALVLTGNSMTVNGLIMEGFPTAWELHELGYTVFVLRYRTWTDLGDNAPVQDLCNAVKFITAHAEQFEVQPDDYALLGYSSGGQIAALFANRDYAYGYGRNGAQKPGVLLLGYPIVNMTVMKPVYHLLFDTTSYSTKYYWLNLCNMVDEDCPPVYFWRGDNDMNLGSASAPGQYDDYEKALQAKGVTYKRTDYKNAPHACSVGNGTDAEGWLKDAVAFWEEQTAQNG